MPLVAVARAVKKLAPGAKIYFVGPEEFPLDALREESVIVKKIIAAGKLRRYFSLWYVWEFIKLPLAFLQSLIVVAMINPDAVLGKGSYGSVLPVISAWLLRKRIILHESDTIPGLANRFLASLTDNIAISFEETKKFFPNKKIYITGNPVRLKYLGLTKEEAQKILSFTPTEDIPSMRSHARDIIFISGGSQGAQKINTIILEALDKLLEKYFIIWSVGTVNYESIEHRVFDNSDNIKIVPFLDERGMAAAYTLCDIAVGRAGAGTIFELAAFGKPSILIPLERKGGDQPYNAQAYANTGATILLKESQLNQENLLSKINEVLDRSDELSQNAKKFAKIEVANQLAKILLDL